MSTDRLLPHLKPVGELSLARYVGGRITGHLVQQSLQQVILCATIIQILVTCPLAELSASISWVHSFSPTCLALYYKV
jgi:hypothetical protein